MTLSARSRGRRAATICFGTISAVFLYTTVANVIERPDGIKIAACFIVGIVVMSLVSRIARSTELRATAVDFDEVAARFIAEAAGSPGGVHLIAHEPVDLSRDRYRAKLHHARLAHRIPEGRVLFLEVVVLDRLHAA